MLTRILMLFCFFLSNLTYADWKGPFEYSKFPEGLIGGHDLDGSPIYLGVTKHEDTPEKKDSEDPANNPDPEKNKAKPVQKKSQKPVWVAGKVREAYRGILYGYESKELYSKDYYLFVPGKNKKYEWVDAKDGEIPENAVAVKDTADKVLCRVKWSTGVFPGELTRGNKACEIGFAGARKRLFFYQVLVLVR